MKLAGSVFAFACLFLSNMAFAREDLSCGRPTKGQIGANASIQVPEWLSWAPTGAKEFNRITRIPESGVDGTSQKQDLSWIAFVLVRPGRLRQDDETGCGRIAVVGHRRHAANEERKGERLGSHPRHRLVVPQCTTVTAPSSRWNGPSA